MNKALAYSSAFVLVLIAAVFLFIKVPVASAQLCDGSGLSGQIKVTGPRGCAIPHKPPSKGGTRGLPCTVSGTAGGVVTAVCSSTKPCCVVKGFTGAGGALAQFAQKILGKLMGGGGGGGAGDSGSYDYDNVDTQENNLLNFDDNLLQSGGDDTGLDLSSVFADTPTEDGSQEDTTEENVEQPATLVERVSGTPEDTVVTTYTDADSGEQIDSEERTLSDVVTDSSGFQEGLSSFESDFNSAYLDPSDGTETEINGLTLADLEAQGLAESQRLGNQEISSTSGSLFVPYDSLRDEEVNNLRNLNNSRVAVSGGLSPFANNPIYGEDANPYGEAEQSNIFVRLGRFVAALFGIGGN